MSLSLTCPCWFLASVALLVPQGEEVGYLWKCPQSIPQVLMMFGAGCVPPGGGGVCQTHLSLSREASALQKYQKPEKTKSDLFQTPAPSWCAARISQRPPGLGGARARAGEAQTSSGHFSKALLVFLLFHPGCARGKALPSLPRLC